MEFAFRAVDRAGKLQVGSVSAVSQAQAFSELARMQLIPVDLQPEAQTRWSVTLSVPLRFEQRLATRDLVSLTIALASLLKAGLVLDRALNILASTSSRAPVRCLCADLERKVRSGSTFGDALESNRKAFPNYYVTMAKAGEVGGYLAEGLDRLGAFVERDAAVRDRIVAALIYPSMLAGMIGLTLVLVLTVVLPKFKTLFAQSQAALPLPTEIVLALGDWLVAYGWLLIVLVLIAVVFTRKAWQGPRWGPWIDGYLLRAHWTFGLIGKTQCSRFFRTVGTLSRSGVPLPEATGVGSGMLRNRALQSGVTRLHQGLKQGEEFSRLLEECAVFPKAAIQLARVGEEPGRLADLLIQVADTLDREAQGTVERLLSVLVPGMTILMGALVAGLISSVLVGILSLNDLAF